MAKNTFEISPADIQRLQVIASDSPEFVAVDMGAALEELVNVAIKQSLPESLANDKAAVDALKVQLANRWLPPRPERIAPPEDSIILERFGLDRYQMRPGRDGLLISLDLASTQRNYDVSKYDTFLREVEARSLAVNVLTTYEPVNYGRGGTERGMMVGGDGSFPSWDGVFTSFRGRGW